MRTTIRLWPELLKRAKKRAVDENRTLASLVEERIVLVLARPVKASRQSIDLPVSRATGGVRPGVDLNRSADLKAVMEGA